MPNLQVCRQFAAAGTCIYGARCRFQHIQGATTQGPPQAAPHPAARHRRRSKKKRTPAPSASVTPWTNFSAFFANYAGFDYNPENSAIPEFYRLCRFMGWGGYNPDREEAHENDINSWHKICVVVGLDPLPDTLEEARDKVLTRYINLIDLVDNPAGRVHSFGSVEELRQYTIVTKKFFPKENAYAGGLLKYLLREILHKYKGNRRPGRGRRQGRRRGRQQPMSTIQTGEIM
ncbi:hypothetical protein PTI98_009737 [Pleurotus ostreatus]|nr:hypothetical protein PTI98_009737 [Pleurotus ostreatus]